MTPRPGHLLVLLAGVGGLGCSVSEYFVTGLSATTDTDTDEPDPCHNSVQEPWESDVDCGGPICEPCSIDEGCKVDADCDTAICAQGLCSDNFCELSNPCPFVTAPCLSMSCDPEFGCVLEPVPDGDPCGSASPDEPDLPDEPTGLCVDGLCTDSCGPCESLSGPCHEGVCDPISNECLVRWAENDAPCLTEEGLDDGRCFQGVCESLIKDSVLFFADFEDPNPGFDADKPWEIGSALPSLCSALEIEDPSTDVNTENGALAGLLIGQCLPPSPFAKSCLASPPIEIPFPAMVTLSYWEVTDLPAEVTRGTIEFLANGQLTEIYETSPQIPEWTQHFVPLGVIEAPQIQLLFCFEAGAQMDSYSGWSIDNIELSCMGCAP